MTDAELWQHCEADCSAQYEKLRARHDEARALLTRLANAEAAYRKAHDLHGDDGRRTSRAWDEMRHEGDAARAFLIINPRAPEMAGNA